MKNKPIHLSCLAILCLAIALPLSGCSSMPANASKQSEKASETLVDEVKPLTPDERLIEAENAVKAVQDLQDGVVSNKVDKELFVSLVDKENYPMSRRSMKVLESISPWLRDVNFDELEADDKTEAYLASTLTAIEFQSAMKEAGFVKFAPVSAEEITVSDEGTKAVFLSKSDALPPFKKLSLEKHGETWMVNAESFIGLYPYEG